MVFYVQTPHHIEIARKSNYPRYLDILNGKKTAVQRELRRGGSGGYESEMQATLLAICEYLGPDCVMYDIGAHVGYYSAMAATMFGADNIKIFAFEPTPDTAGIAEEIRDVNGLGFDIIQVAMTDQPGTVDLFLSPKAETSNSLNADFRTGSTPISVRATTIDAFVGEGKPAPDFVKIDVETFEHAVLKGGMNTFAQVHPYLTCELLPSGTIAEVSPVLDRLQDLGYRFYQISPDERWPVYSASDVTHNIDGQLPDWLFAPADLTAEFFQLVVDWRNRLGQCGADTNIKANWKYKLLHPRQNSEKFSPRFKTWAERT